MLEFCEAFCSFKGLKPMIYSLPFTRGLCPSKQRCTLQELKETVRSLKAGKAPRALTDFYLSCTKQSLILFHRIRSICSLRPSRMDL